MFIVRGTLLTFVVIVANLPSVAHRGLAFVCCRNSKAVVGTIGRLVRLETFGLFLYFQFLALFLTTFRFFMMPLAKLFCCGRTLPLFLRGLLRLHPSAPQYVKALIGCSSSFDFFHLLSNFKLVLFSLSLFFFYFALHRLPELPLLLFNNLSLSFSLPISSQALFFSDSLLSLQSLCFSQQLFFTRLLVFLCPDGGQVLGRLTGQFLFLLLYVPSVKVVPIGRPSVVDSGMASIVFSTCQRVSQLLVGFIRLSFVSDYQSGANEGKLTARNSTASLDAAASALSG
jgi:hypothetical protein